MLKVLIGLKSCWRDTENGFNQAVRDTWAQDVKGADVRFFVGSLPVSPKWDEVGLECPDDYNGLPWKTKAICQWAWDQDYTHVFLCDSDTFLMPARLLDSGFENFDYVGHFNGARGIPNAIYGSLYSWASGGSGYWLSRQAMKIVADSDPIPLSICPISKIPCEDLLIRPLMGPLIANNTIIVSHDPRYASGYDEQNYKTEISSHYCSTAANRKFDPEWMRRHYIANCL